jgi:hypothetical protein
VGVDCPYCGSDVSINHDDGYGYEEDSRHEEYCGKCEKNFVYTTMIMFHYNAYKADCLNDSEHKYKQSSTHPKWATKMVCEDCDEKRAPTTEEKKLHDIPEYKDGK